MIWSKIIQSREIGIEKNLGYIQNDVLVPFNYPLLYSTALSYYLEGGKQSCDQICEKYGALCAATNHGFTNAGTLAIFQDRGVNCTTGSDTDEQTSTYEPMYFDDWRYIGWKNIPNEINCGSAPDNIYVKRLCPCVTR